MWVKRDDLFSGPAGINGTKFRQLLRLAGDAVEAGAKGLLSAASGHSPQVPMTAVVAHMLGVPAHIVTGALSLETAMRSPGVALAVQYGATIEPVLPAYNPVLQARGRAALEERPGWYGVPYAISLPEPATPEAARRFHDGSAQQVRNLPFGSYDKLLVPCGSANSAGSILYGLARDQLLPPHILLVGIGPSRLDWLRARLELLEASEAMERVEYVDLHPHFDYSQRVPYDLDGIELHPNYEGKIAQWAERNSSFRDLTGWGEARTVLWIVGSEPTPVREPARERVKL